MIHWKVNALQKGQNVITSEKGNSMTPKLKSGQAHQLTPCKWEDCEIGDIVFCKVRGNYYTHLVYAKNETKGVQIGNNHGHINGWTKQVFGKVIKIL